MTTPMKASWKVDLLAAILMMVKALLGMWQGGAHWRSLYAVRQPENECFTLYGVTRDGRSIVCGHDPDLSASRPGSQNPLDRRRWLRLPR